MRCFRCGSEQQPIDTVAVRINDVNEVLRRPLCMDCRGRVRTAIERALQPVGDAAA